MIGKVKGERPRVLEEIPFKGVPGNGRDTLHRTVILLENSRGRFPSCIFDSEEMARSYDLVPLTPMMKRIIPWEGYTLAGDGAMEVNVGLREEDVPPGKLPCAFVISDVRWGEEGFNFSIRTYGINASSPEHYHRRGLTRSKISVPYLETIWAC